jgi:hypothetical protein
MQFVVLSKVLCSQSPISDITVRAINNFLLLLLLLLLSLLLRWRLLLCSFC